MNISLEKINKSLLLVALVSLVFRTGSFSASSVPKIFESLFLLLVVLTLVYIVKNNKYAEFFQSIPRRIWIAISCLTFVILCGWLTAVFYEKVPSSINMVLEFGTFVIAIGTLILLLFYTKNDKVYTKLCFYALFSPIILIIFTLFPRIANNFHLAYDGTFKGFTDNVNILSKMFIIPAMFFVAGSLLETKNLYKKIIYIIVSGGSFAMILWAAERGAMLSVAIGAIVIFLIETYRNFSWRKMFYNVGIGILILLVTFFLAPYAAKQIALDRVLNSDKHQSGYDNVKNNSIGEIFKISLSKKPDPIIIDSSTATEKKYSSEPRIEIWSRYIHIATPKPFGIGPNTHVETHIPYYRGVFISPGPHNTYIQFWLWGGLLALLSFSYLLFFAYKNLKARLSFDYSVVTVGLFGSLVALSIAIMFNDSISLYCFWALLALCIQKWNNQ